MRKLIWRLNSLYDLLPYSLMALLARVVAGLVFFRSGLTKIDPEAFGLRPATFFLFEQEYKVRILKYLGLSVGEFPFPAPHALAYAATTVELLMPLALWFGLGTRFAATVLLLQTCVIETVYPDSYMEHALWAIALLMLMRFGPGLLSIDQVVARLRGAISSGKTHNSTPLQIFPS